MGIKKWKKWKRSLAGWLVVFLLVQNAVAPLDGFAAGADAAGSEARSGQDGAWADRLLTGARLLDKDGRDMEQEAVDGDEELRLAYTYDFGRTEGFKASPDSATPSAATSSRATAEGLEDSLGIREYLIRLPAGLEFDDSMELGLGVLDADGFALEDHSAVYEEEGRLIHLYLDGGAALECPKGTVEVPVRLSDESRAALGLEPEDAATSVAARRQARSVLNSSGSGRCRIAVPLGGGRSADIRLFGGAGRRDVPADLMGFVVNYTVIDHKPAGGTEQTVTMKPNETTTIEVKNKEHQFTLLYEFLIDDLTDGGFEKAVGYPMPFPNDAFVPLGAEWVLTDKDHGNEVIGKVSPDGDHLKFTFDETYYDKATSSVPGEGYNSIRMMFTLTVTVKETVFTQTEQTESFIVNGSDTTLKLKPVQDDLSVNLSKSGKRNPASEKEALWEVALTAANSSNKIGSGYVVEDDLTVDASASEGIQQEIVPGSLMFSPALTEGVDYEITYKRDDGNTKYIGYTITFLWDISLDTAAGHKLVISYKTRVPDEYFWKWVEEGCQSSSDSKNEAALTIKNKAKLSYLERSQAKEGSVSEKIYNPLVKTMDRSDPENGTIRWKIEVNKGGDTLQPFEIAEVVGDGLEVTEITCGTGSLQENVDWKVSGPDPVTGLRKIELLQPLTVPAVFYVQTKVQGDFIDSGKDFSNQVQAAFSVAGKNYLVWSRKAGGKLPGGAGIFTKSGSVIDLENAYYAWEININQNCLSQKAVKITDDLDGSLLLDASKCVGEVVGLQKIKANPADTAAYGIHWFNMQEQPDGSLKGELEAGADFGESSGGTITATFVPNPTDKKSGTFTLGFGASTVIKQSYKLHLKTEASRFAASGEDAKHSNSAKMEMDGHSAITVSSPGLDQRSIVTEKTADYDRDTNVFTWVLTSNKDGKQLDNAKLYDHFPDGYASIFGLQAGQPLPDTMTASLLREETVNSGNWIPMQEGTDYTMEVVAGTGGPSIAFALGELDPVSGDYHFGSPVRAVITGRIAPETMERWERENQNRPQNQVNEGYLEAGNYKNGGTAKPSLPVNPVILYKESRYIRDDEQIEWTIHINPEGYILKGASALIEDTFDPKAMKLLTGTVTLWRKGYGAGASPNYEKVPYAPEALDYDVASGKFSFTLPLDGGDLRERGYSYKLTYRTDIFKPEGAVPVDGNYEYKNDVLWQIGGESVKTTKVQTVAETTVNQWGGAGDYKFLRLEKLDASTDMPLKGARFRLKGDMSNGKKYGGRADGKVVVTDEHGGLYFTKMRAGSYTLEEVIPPAGYDTTLFPTRQFEVTEQEIELAVTAYNKRDDSILYNLEFIKKGRIGTVERPLPGVRFKLAKVGSRQEWEAVSDADGKVRFEGLPGGDYRLEETEAPLGYQGIDPLEITLDGTDSEIPLEPVINVKKTASLEVRKQDGSGRPLAGAEFTIYLNGVALQSVVSAADGLVRFDGLYDGTYEIKETRTPEGYIPKNPDETLVTATITLAQLGTVVTAGEVTNEHKAPARVSLRKVDESTQKALKDAVFGLYQGGKLLMEAVSDENGIVRFDIAQMGAYAIRETKPPQGYEGAVVIEGIVITGDRLDTDIELGTFTNRLKPTGGNGGNGTESGGGNPSTPGGGDPGKGPGVPSNPAPPANDPPSDPAQPGTTPAEPNRPNQGNPPENPPGVVNIPPGQAPRGRVETGGKSKEEITQLLMDGYVPLGSAPPSLSRPELVQWILDNEVPLYAPLPKTGQAASPVLLWFLAGIGLLLACGFKRAGPARRRKEKDGPLI